MIRFFIISLLIAVVLCLPQFAQDRDVMFPLQGIFSIPATGLTYMLVFFHELGHAVTWWIFGYPALPTFDAEYGGGMTYHFERSVFLLCGIYGVSALAVVALVAKEYLFAAAALLVLTALHGLLVWTGGDEALGLFMGHGAEMLVGGFCLYRGIAGMTDGDRVERWLNAVFGWFVFLRLFDVCYGLATDELAREVYEQQKGGHGFGDLSRLADMLDVSLRAASLGTLFLGLILLLTAILLGYRAATWDIRD